MTVRELKTKADLKPMKVDLVKWIAGLFPVKAAVIAALVKL